MRSATRMFKKGVKHFCLHSGESVVIGVGRSLGLDERDLEPVRMSLHQLRRHAGAAE